MTRFFFYLRYATNNLRRSGQWTTFAILCVAAGVATVVALRGLGLSITDSLLSNLRQYNHGDVNISSVSSFGPFSLTFQGGESERLVYRTRQVEEAQEWIDSWNGEMTAYALVSNLQITAIDNQQTGRPQFSSSLLIDPPSFARLNDVVAIDPVGVRIDQLFTGGYDVVISQNMAEEHGIQVGDDVRVSGTEQPFTVRGIVSTDAEANIENIFAAFFGFAYFDRQHAEMLGLNSNPNTIGFFLPDGTSGEEITKAAGEIASTVFSRETRYTPRLLERNQELADMVGRFIVAMGLGALLIGGVGIMNTMLVLVGRRTMEIASLKTFGLKGKQIAAMFMAEAFLLGLLGSIVGIILGLLIGGVVNRYGEAFLQQKLPWRIYPEAVLYGFGLGMVVTIIFGVMPVLTATRIRPGIILRPNETHIPRASIFQWMVGLLVIVVVLGLIAGQILGPVVEQTPLEGRLPDSTVLGIIGVALTLAFLALLTGFLWIVVWLLGHLPTFGWIELRLALRNLSTRRIRTATTLLALTAGMFALSSITYFGLGAQEIVRFQFSQTLGGNVMIVPLMPPALSQPIIDLGLAYQEGVQYKTIMNLNFGRILRVDGNPIVIEDTQRDIPLTLMARESDNPGLSNGPLLQGRDLTPEDRGKFVIVLSEQSLIETLVRDFTLEDVGIGIGSNLMMRVNSEWLNFEVVGIVGGSNRFTPNIAGAYVPSDVPGMESSYVIDILQVEPQYVDQVLVNMSSIPLLFPIDVTFIDGLIRRLIEQLAAIPTVVGILSLLAAAVIMANTVSLAILERRRQIGVLKAIGLKRRRVLWIMLLENTIVGLVGGVLGIALSSLGVSVMTALGTNTIIPIPNEAAAITIGLLIVSIIIAWLATLLSARVAISERVMRVLRYE